MPNLRNDSKGGFDFELRLTCDCEPGILPCCFLLPSHQTLVTTYMLNYVPKHLIVNIPNILRIC